MPGQPFPMEVEIGKVREFATAVRAGSEDPNPTDLNPTSSPTFLVSAAFWRRPEHEVVNHSQHFDRTLHAAQEFIFPTGPARVGARLTGQAHIGSVTAKQGRRGGHMTFTEVVTVYTDEAGDEVARDISTTVLVERPPTNGATTEDPNTT